VGGPAELYPARVLEHFRQPRNTGRLRPGPGIVQSCAGTRAQGVEVRLGIRFEAARAVEARFEAYGCPWTIAAMSLLTGMIVGRTVDELAGLGWRDVAAGLEVPPERHGRMLIVEDVLKACIRLAEADATSV